MLAGPRAGIATMMMEMFLRAPAVPPTPALIHPPPVRTLFFVCLQEKLQLWLHLLLPPDNKEEFNQEVESLPLPQQLFCMFQQQRMNKLTLRQLSGVPKMQPLPVL